MHYIPFCALIFLCFAASTTTANLVPAVCKYISHANPKDISYEYCVTTLGSDPRSSSSMAGQLAEISIQMGIARANDVASTIQEVLKHWVSDGIMRNAFTQCLNLYTGVSDNLREGLEAVKSGDYRKANGIISAAIDKATKCRDGIKEKSNSSTVGEKNTDFLRLGALSLGFTKLLPIVN